MTAACLAVGFLGGLVLAAWGLSQVRKDAAALTLARQLHASQAWDCGCRPCRAWREALHGG